jgi:8-oxo-dGTP pyrophosphatase MutT (NUDIX family)
LQAPYQPLPILNAQRLFFVSNSVSDSKVKLPAFDPKSVPVLAQAVDLPPVAPEAMTAGALRQRFAHPPIWTPEIHTEPLFSSRPQLPAAVLIAIVQHPEPTVLFTERTVTMSTHAGQVAFPGGKIDSTDLNAEAAALRETFEETGIQPQWVSVVGHLPIYVTGTNFLVRPVVGLVQPGFSLAPNAHEVADVFEVPLAYLMDPRHHKLHEFQWEGHVRQWYSMAYPVSASANAKERFIWGATAGMLRNLYAFLRA